MPDTPDIPVTADTSADRVGPQALSWASATAGGAEVTVVRGLREGGSPWLVRAGDRQLVLRTAPRAEAGRLAFEAAGLRVAPRAGVPAPELLGYDDGTAAGVAAVLSTVLPGSSLIPADPRPARLRALGAAAARLHAVACPPSADLPRREHPIGDEDFAAMRAGHDLGPLQREADRVVAAGPPDGGPTVLVHGDLWQGNTMWVGDSLAGLIDWDAAGVGAPGVDLGSLRLDAAFCYGPGAADEVLVGWTAAAGRPAADVAYWDLVAAVCTPPGLGWFPQAIAAQGRPDLTRELLVARHEDFIRAALDSLR